MPFPGMGLPCVCIRRDGFFFLLFEVRTWREMRPRSRVSKPQPVGGRRTGADLEVLRKCHLLEQVVGML